MPPARPSRSPPPTLASNLARGAAGAAAGFAGVSALVFLLAASGGRRDHQVCVCVCLCVRERER
jgi:hypothetical protein